MIQENFNSCGNPDENYDTERKNIQALNYTVQNIKKILSELVKNGVNLKKFTGKFLKQTFDYTGET